MLSEKATKFNVGARFLSPDVGGADSSERLERREAGSVPRCSDNQKHLTPDDPDRQDVRSDGFLPGFVSLEMLEALVGESQPLRLEDWNNRNDNPVFLEGFGTRAFALGLGK